MSNTTTNKTYMVKTDSVWYDSRKELADSLSDLEKAANEFRKELELTHEDSSGNRIETKLEKGSRTHKMREKKYDIWYDDAVAPTAIRLDGMDKAILDSVNAEVRKKDAFAYGAYFRDLGFSNFSWTEKSYDRIKKGYDLRGITWDYTLDITLDIWDRLPKNNRFKLSNDGFLILPPDAKAVERYNSDLEWNTMFPNSNRKPDPTALNPTKCKIIVNKYYHDNHGVNLPSTNGNLRCMLLVYRDEVIDGVTHLCTCRELDFSLSIGSSRLESYTMLGGDVSYELSLVYLEAAEYCRGFALTLKPYTDSTYVDVECEKEKAS